MKEVCMGRGAVVAYYEPMKVIEARLTITHRRKVIASHTDAWRGRGLRVRPDEIGVAELGAAGEVDAGWGHAARSGRMSARTLRNCGAM